VKNLMLALGLVVLSSTGFAATKCDQAAVNAAQASFDAKAQNEDGVSGGYIPDVPATVLAQRADGSTLYNFIGAIGKAEFNIQVDLDQTCQVISVQIAPVAID